MTDVLPAVGDGVVALARGGALTGGMAAVGVVGGVAPWVGLALVGDGLPADFGGVDGVVGVDTARSDEFSGGGTGGTVVPDGFGLDGEGPPGGCPPAEEPPDDVPPEDG